MEREWNELKFTAAAEMCSLLFSLIAFAMPIVMTTNFILLLTPPDDDFCELLESDVMANNSRELKLAFCGTG